MNKTERLLIKFLIPSAIIFTLSLIFPTGKKNAQKTVKSAILNPKYKDDLSEIKITVSNDSILIKKYEDLWLMTKKNGDEETSTLADSAIINSLVEKAIKIQNMYKISDKKSNFDALKVTESNSTSISFIGKDNKLYTKVHFGYKNSLLNRIALRAENSNSVFEAENLFDQYLNCDINYWADGLILNEASNPLYITFSDEKTDLKTSETNASFSETKKTLTSLRHGRILHKGDLKNMSFESKLIMQNGDGRIVKIYFYKENASKIRGTKTENDEGSYFYTRSFIPSPLDSKERAEALKKDDALYEISSWTYERIKSAF